MEKISSAASRWWEREKVTRLGDLEGIVVSLLQIPHDATAMMPEIAMQGLMNAPGN